MSIGFIGLGNIGGGCARRIIAAGMDVIAHDLNDDVLASLVEQGAQAASTPADVAADASVIYLSLPSPEASLAVVAGDNGLLQTASPETVIVDLSTNSLASTRALAQQCDAVGVHYLDAPVSGGAGAAESGELTVMASGSTAGYERAKASMLTFARDDTSLLGPSGTGTLLKLINNQIFLVGSQVFGEGYLLAAKAGLDVDQFLTVLKTSSGAMMAPLADLVVGRHWDSSTYDLSLAAKDLRLVLESSRDIHTPMPLTEAASGVLQQSLELGLGDSFFLRSFEALEHSAGFVAEPPNPNPTT
jgi:3-hydroxyisobutyrate dehydrogenase-like beta-hydroxyacid dehydrogenase